MNKSRLKGSLFLFLGSLIWGTAFVAQSVGMEYVEPLTFTASRSIIGSIVLLPVILFRNNRGFMKPVRDLKMTVTGGIICGLFLCLATNLQQTGLTMTTVGKAGFITAMYIVLVPVIGIFLGRRAHWKIWTAVALAAAGLYLLSMSGSLRLQTGDFLMVLCAFAFAFQILSIDHFIVHIDPFLLSCMEFLVCGIVSLVLAVLFETPQLSALAAAKWTILYTGVLSSGVAYTLQVLGQKELEPSLASLIMSFESVISALSGWLILGQVLRRREITGCVIMFAAILLAQSDTGE
ncbi:MAG: DMT family transporter [Lachnospiraceae bacterium]|nr:DMT family transporter [Lachnospiraceae bacterium]